MDEMVLQVQRYLNLTYDGIEGYKKAPETGKTGWDTMYALTRALQIELGITVPSDTFGALTAQRYKEWGELELGQVQNTANAEKIVRILQGACWCKGYNPGGFTGNFGEGTRQAVLDLQIDANLPIKDGKVYDYVFKAFLTMDAYKLTPGGDPKIREMQRDLNSRYYISSGVQPTDGHYQRGTNKALVFAIQTEQGIPLPNQTGTVGPTTRDLLPTLSYGSKGVFVKLFQYALYVNNFDAGIFDGIFGLGVQKTVKEFQSFVGLLPDGYVGKQTWLSALVSTGDPNRKGTAADCITEVTAERAQSLKASGYRTIGRYLTNVEGGLNKKIQNGELNAIFNSGLSVFPIYQTNGASSSYFSATQGIQDAEAAYHAAKSYGFKLNTTIYFAVDFDALGNHITNNIIPYFKSINEKMRDHGNFYKIGVYGSRNVCISVSEAGYASTSFVSGMSTGFSGNLGFPLPSNWAFDQISTITIGSGIGVIEIDNNIMSGRDLGVNTVDNVSSLDEKTEEYKLLFKKWLEIAGKIPLLKNNPNLFTNNFEFNKEYWVSGNHLYEAYVKTGTYLVMPGLSETSLVNFQNGQLTVNAESMLGDTATSLTLEQFNGYKSFVEGISLTANNGLMTASISPTGRHLEIETKIYNEEVLLNIQGDKVILEVSIKIILKNTNSLDNSVSGDPNFIFTPLINKVSEVPLVAVGIATLVILTLPLATTGTLIGGGGVAVASTTAAFLAFILGTDDINDNND